MRHVATDDETSSSWHSAKNEKRYFEAFYRSFSDAAATDNDIASRLRSSLLAGEEACRQHLRCLEEREYAVICQGFGGTLGRVHPVLSLSNLLSADESEAAHRAVIECEFVAFQLQAWMYRELLDRVNVEEFEEPEARHAVHGMEVPQWATARQEYVTRLNVSSHHGTEAYTYRKRQEKQIQQLALLHVAEQEGRMEIERHQRLYIGALVEIHKKRLRTVLPKQAKYATSHVVLNTSESQAVITLESTQRLAVAFDEREELRQLQASEVVALFRLRAKP